jgi:dTDP-4-dehydrorhamnose reductase
VTSGPVVVVGAGGQLAWAVIGAFEPTCRVVALRRAELDITDDTAVAAVLGEIKPSLIVNGAAYNDVDGAELRPTLALEVNAFGVRALARTAAAVGAVLIHYSTDFVFDGTATRPHTEDDAPNPQSVYAASKLLGEWFALEAPASYVLRVESLFGAAEGQRGRSSLDRIAEGILAGHEVPVFTDRTVSPSYILDVAAATRAVFDRRPPVGLYHCVNSGWTTWEGIAHEVARLLGREPHLRRTTLAATALPASRPVYCAMSNAKLASVGITMPTWQDAVAGYLAARGQARA